MTKSSWPSSIHFGTALDSLDPNALPTIKNFQSPKLETIGDSESPAVEVRVPSGWKVIGGDLRTVYNESHIISRSAPVVNSNGAPVGWTANAVAQNKKGRLQVYAVAIYDPWDHWMVKIVEKKETFSATVTLPRG